MNTVGTPTTTRTESEARREGKRRPSGHVRPDHTTFMAVEAIGGSPDQLADAGHMLRTAPLSGGTSRRKGAHEPHAVSCSAKPRRLWSPRRRPTRRRSELSGLKTRSGCPGWACQRSNRRSTSAALRQETYEHPARPPFCSLRFGVCLQTTSKLAIIIMSSCSRLWQWKT